MKRFAVAVAAFTLLSSSAHAQKSRTPTPQNEGLMLGGITVLAMGITISGPEVRENITTEMGQGVGVQVGYGFSARLMAFASGTVAKQNSDYADGSFGLGLLEVGARMTFPQPGKRLVPYASAHVGTHGLGAHSNGGGISVTLRLSGTQVGVGGGILYALTPKMALDAGVVADRGKFGKMTLTGDVNTVRDVDVNASTTLRLKVGFNWHP